MQKRIFIFLFFVFTFLSYSIFAEAALQFLPRYQGGYGVRSQDGGRDKAKLSCESFGGYAKQAGQSCSGMFYRAGLTCYKECFCDTSTYQYTTASHQGTGKLCASLSGVCNDKNGAHYANCTLNTCNNRNSTWIGEDSKASYTSNNYTCTSQETSGKDGVCYVCACPSDWATGSCPANANDCKTCKAVSPYTTNKFNLVSCKAGYYKNGNSCTQCPAGYECDGVSKTQCPGGSYAAAGASTCSPCPAGQSSDAGASACTNCAAGTYAGEGSSSCLECKAGTYSKAGAASCSDCDDGNYSLKGASNCISCSPRKSNSAHTTCVDCTSNAECTKVSGGECSDGTCKYPVVSCNTEGSAVDTILTAGTSVEIGGQTIYNYASPSAVPCKSYYRASTALETMKKLSWLCEPCTAQAEDGTQTSGMYNCTCRGDLYYPNHETGNDTLCFGSVRCPLTGCAAGKYYSGGTCLACSGNTYSQYGAFSCTECPSGEKANADHSACKAACDSSYKYACTGTGYNGGSGTPCDGKYTSCTCASGYEWSNGSCDKLKPTCAAIGGISYDKMKEILTPYYGSSSIIYRRKLDETGGYIEVDVALVGGVVISKCDRLSSTSDNCYTCSCDYTACNLIAYNSCFVDGGRYYGYDDEDACLQDIREFECDQNLWYPCVSNS